MSCWTRCSRCASCSTACISRGAPDAGRRVSYIDLRIIPLVHAQRLDLGDVGAQLAMQGCAAHAQEDAQL